MAFTFDPSLPTARDRMRLAIGDTDPTNPLRDDATYDAMLTYYENETTATYTMARTLATQFGREATSVSVPGGPSVSYSDRVRAWSDLAKSLESLVASDSPAGGGLNQSMLSRPGMNVEATTEYRRPIDWSGW